MNTPPRLNPARGMSIAQLVVGILSLVLTGLSLLGMVLLMVFSPQTGEVNTVQRDQFIHIIWILLLVLLLTIPSVVTSLQTLINRPVRHARRSGLIGSSVSLLAIPLLLLFGSRLATNQATPWLLAPTNILLVLLPLWWIVEAGRFQLDPESSQRRWGVINFSVYIMLPLTMLVEIVVIFIGLVMGLVWLLQQPEFMPLIQQLSNQALLNPLEMQLPEMDFLPILQKPGVLATGLLAITLVVPMIEEALKPLALWVIYKRPMTPQAGFIAGLLCGASFALVESVFSLSAVPSDAWMSTVIGRAGTGLLHALTAGLNGWALAATWQDGKFLRQGLVYVLTVLIHGTWNFFALFMGISQVGLELPFPVDPVLARISPWILVFLAVGLLALLFFMNRYLHRSRPIALPQSLDFPPPLPTE